MKKRIEISAKQMAGREEKVADILSDYMDSINEGEALSITEILEKNSEIADVLSPKLKAMEELYHRFLMKKAPEEFKEKLLSNLLAKMDALYPAYSLEGVLKHKRHIVLKYLREQQGKSIEQVAQEAGIEREKVIALETNEKEPVTPRLWTILANVYKVNIKKLGIILGNVPKWQDNLSGLTFATQYRGEDLTDEEKELINKFFQDKTGNKNGK